MLNLSQEEINMEELIKSSKDINEEAEINMPKTNK